MSTTRWINMSEKIGIACREADHPHTIHATHVEVEEQFGTTVLMGITRAACEQCYIKIVTREEPYEDSID